MAHAVVDPDLVTDLAEVAGEHLVLPRSTMAAATARAFVRKQLVGYPDDLVDRAALLSSELVTNALLLAGHALDIGVGVLPGRVVVMVRDDDRRSPAPGEAQDADPFTVVRRLADEFGWAVTARGKSVWFGLATSPGNRP